MIQWFCAWFLCHVLTWTAVTNRNWQQTKVAFLSSCISLHRENFLCLHDHFFLKTKAIEQPLYTYCNNDSSMSLSNGFLPALSSRFLLLLAASSFLFFCRHSLFLFRSTPNFGAAFWLLWQSPANRFIQESSKLAGHVPIELSFLVFTFLRA